MSSINIKGTFKFEMNSLRECLKKRELQNKGEAQKYVDSEVLRLCTPMAPKDTGELIRSGIRETKIGSGKVVYHTPYSRRWYYEPAKFQGAPMRGNYWFDRMKNNGGRASILAGLAKLVGAKGEK